MIFLPKSVDEALSVLADHPDAALRAGGTDLQDRRHLATISGLSGSRPAPKLGPVIDLRDLHGRGAAAPKNPSGAHLDAITVTESEAWLGALSTLQAIADHPRIQAGWPGVAQAAGALATPQIRRQASLAGNLRQAPRCWYYRSPDYSCLRKGGEGCPARGGQHPWHVCFDTEPCPAPHASTLAVALLAYDAEVEVVEAPAAAPTLVPVAAALAPTTPKQPAGLPPTAMISALRLPAPLADERSAYARAASRSRSEWALVEASVRLQLGPTGEVRFARVCVGAVAPLPLRLTQVEDALLGHAPTPERLASAAALASAGASPLPQTGYKLALLEGCVLTALEQALAAAPTASPQPDSPTTPGHGNGTSPTTPGQATGRLPTTPGHATGASPTTPGQRSPPPTTPGQAAGLVPGQAAGLAALGHGTSASPTTLGQGTGEGTGPALGHSQDTGPTTTPSRATDINLELCARLRWKSISRDLEDPAEILHAFAKNQVPYSCLQTCRAWGPDDELAAPELCHRERTCFVPSVLTLRLRKQAARRE